MKKTIGIIGLFGLLFIGLNSTSLMSQAELASNEKIEAPNSVVVLELFTSQGCSSCPPADELLQKIKQSNRQNVYTIAYHVDYWNYIGWDDPFSRSDFTAKQTKYNQKFKNRNNYTPQVVVNGKDHCVGSNARKIYENINLYSAMPEENTVEIASISREPRKAILEYKVDGPIDQKNLRAVLIIDHRITEVKRGENRNRSLTNSNIAVAETRRSLDQKNGRIQIIIPDLVLPEDKLSVVLLVENEKADILGATRLSIP